MSKRFSARQLAAALVLAAVIVCSSWVPGCRRQEGAEETPAAGAPEGQEQPAKPETPEPAEKPEPEQAEPEKADQEGWESLFDGKTLGKWKPSDFWKPGKVHVADGNLVLETGTGDMTGVFWGGDPAMLPRIGYEVELQAQRVEGSDFFCALTFPYKDDCASLVVGGWGGGVVGISSLDGMDASENETTGYMEFQNGRWYTIRLRVADNHIQAWIDDKKVVDTEPGERDVDVRIEVEASKPLGVAAWNTKSALRRIRVRRLLDK